MVKIMKSSIKDLFSVGGAVFVLPVSFIMWDYCVHDLRRKYSCTQRPVCVHFWGNMHVPIPFVEIFLEGVK